MSGSVKSVVLALVVLVVAPGGSTADAPSDSLPDSWSGLIALEWKSGIPDDSPLHQQVERVMMKYRKEWLMQVDFREFDRDTTQVRYRCDSTSVTYLQTSNIEGKNGAVRTHEDWKIEVEDRILNHYQCNLVLVVDAVEKRYWIDEVGRFEIRDARKTGTIVMSIDGGSGARSVTEPIDKETDVTESVRFKGRFSDPWPKVLFGIVDANVEPPPGIDITHETLGGTIAWQLHRGWKPGDEIPWLEDCIGFANTCSSFVSEFDDGECRLNDLCFCLFVSTVTGTDPSSAGSQPVTVEACLELYCPWAPGIPEFDAALDVIRDHVGGAR
ncbi:MAG: hypothetical protein V2I67_00520 [Thermoanaerobaculales bacterium]|nr:hypothetical protein [Thermoanaerobaculales bacterium]